MILVEYLEDLFFANWVNARALTFLMSFRPTSSPVPCGEGGGVSSPGHLLVTFIEDRHASRSARMREPTRVDAILITCMRSAYDNAPRFRELLGVLCVFRIKE